MAQVQMTIVSTGGKFSVPDENIILVATDTLGALVQYINEKDGQRYQKVVSETPTLIASQSATLIAITDAESNVTYWVSYDRIGTVDQTGTYVNFDYDIEGAAPRKISVTQTIAQLYTLIYEKEGDTVYLYDAVSATVDTISLTAANGDLTTTFTAGVTFTVFGSSTAGMNTIWEVTSSAYSGGKTVITVTGQIPVASSETGSLRISL